MTKDPFNVYLSALDLGKLLTWQKSSGLYGTLPTVLNTVFYPVLIDTFYLYAVAPR